MELTEEDVAVLERLATGTHTVEAIASDRGASADALEERVASLEDNGLVAEADDGGYSVTRSGRRALRSSGDEFGGGEIDVPLRVENRIETLSLRADAERAVRKAFSFLKQWGEATASEITDGVYSEHPAGMDDADEWWAELVREPLATLPDVESSDEGTVWRYQGRPDVDEPTADGRQVITDDAPYGSAKHAIERVAETDAQAAALSVAFERVRESGRLAVDDLDRAVGGDAREEIEDAVDRLPGVRRTGDGAWEYDPDWEGPSGETEE